MIRLMRFAAVGLGAAVVHMLAFEIARRTLVADRTGAWLIGFVVAAITAWALNRTVTFNDRRQHRTPRELALYLAVAGLGALAHYGVFMVTTSLLPVLANHPWLGIVPGSAASFVVTYLGASWLVFPEARGTDNSRNRP